MSTLRATAAIGLACALLAGCGGSETIPAFAPAEYSYLPKLRLNVGALSIIDHAAASSGPDELAQNAPIPPDQALQTMARQRLVAAGTSGSAVFTIDQASIFGAGGGGLDGKLAVHLDILTASGGHAGYAEAHVSRQFTPGSELGDGTRNELYMLTRQMMRTMNVEFEYQVRRTLSDWLVDASGAPVAGSVGQQTLAPPGAAGAALSTMQPNGASVGNTPVGATPLSPASTPSPAPPAGVPLRSPPPGFLQPPPANLAPNTP